MKRLCILLVLAGCGASARNHVERAVEAHGGHDVLRAITNFHVATEGNFMGMAYTTVTHGRGPHDWRHDMDMAEMGKMVLWTLGPDADTYMSMSGKTTVQEGEARRGILAHARGATAALLPNRLLSESVEIALAEPEQIGDRECKGIDIDFGDGMKLMTFLFDPDTKRIARMRFSFFDSQSLTWIHAIMDMGDYREIDGVWVAHKSSMTMSGAAFTEEVTGVRFNRTLDEALLARPATVPAPDVTVTDEPAASVAVHKFVGPPDQIGAAIQRVGAWITKYGGQAVGPPTTIHKKPMNFVDMSKNETVIHVPVQIGDVPKGGDIWLGRTKAYQLASSTVTGNMMAIMHQWGLVHDWCQKNGYVRSGPRRMRTLSFDQATGMATAEIGFPVKPAPTGYYPGG